MTSPSPGKDDSLWRDLAASVVQQVADRVRSAQSGNRRSTPDHEPPRHGSHDRAPGSGFEPDHRSHSARQESERSAGAPAPPGSIGSELKRLMINGIRATSDSLGEYQAARDRRQAERDRRESEREQRRLQAPMRQARSRSKASKVAAVALGTFTVGLAAGSVAAAIEPDVPAAVVGGAVSVAAGAGTVSLTRRSRRYAATANEHARALGLTEAAAIDLPGGDASALVLPPLSSLAHDPVLRLISQRQALAELLPHIDDVAPELAPLARQSERSLAEYAERVVRLERARSAAAATSLDAPLARAVAQLEEGVQAHQKLVEAAATVLAELESAEYGAQPHEQIGEAADRLQALAEGLRQVRNDIPVTNAQPSSMPPITDPHTAPARPAPRRARKAHRRPDAAG